VAIQANARNFNRHSRRAAHKQIRAGPGKIRRA
jgi:hypothetical protein